MRFDPANPRLGQEELLVLAHTPGVPEKWVFAVFGFSQSRRARFRAMVDGVDKVRLRELAEANAASVTDVDAWNMLVLTPDAYRGPIPLYAQLWLQKTPLSDKAVAEQLGINRKRVMRWRQSGYGLGPLV